MGSSSVTMWPSCSLLMRSTRQASVVDLPQPVAPVTRITPLRFSDSFITTSGMRSAWGSGSEKRTQRMTAASEPRCL